MWCAVRQVVVAAGEAVEAVVDGPGQAVGSRVGVRPDGLVHDIGAGPKAGSEINVGLVLNKEEGGLDAGKKKRKKKAKNVGVGPGVRTRSMTASAHEGNSDSLSFKNSSEFNGVVDWIGPGNSGPAGGVFELGVNSKFFGEVVGFDPMFNEFINSGPTDGPSAGEEVVLDFNGFGLGGFDPMENEFNQVGLFWN